MTKRKDTWQPVGTSAKKVMDDILREMFRNGGPMRPVPAPKKVIHLKTKSDPVLLAEQQRLIKTWGKK